jgi:hypothetical protein
MNKLRLYLYKLNDKGNYICNLHAPGNSFYEVISKRSYREVGRKMLNILNKNLSEEVLKNPLYLTTLKDIGNPKIIKNPEGKRLTKLKSSLEKYIQDNKLNIKLEVAA